MTHLLVTLALLAPLAPPAEERPPIQTPHFRFHQTEGTAKQAARLARNAEAHYLRLCRQVHACDRSDRPIEVWVARDAEAFAQAFPDGSPMAEWAVGVTFLASRRVVLRAHGSALFTLDETFEHELSHVLLEDISPGERLPRWFFEGVAIWQAGEPVVDRLAAAHNAALTDNLIPFAEMNRGFPAQGARVGLAYAQSALFLRWLISRYGRLSMDRLFRTIADGQPFERAFLDAFQRPPAVLQREWRDGLKESSSVIFLLRDGEIFWVLMGVIFLWAAAVTYRRRHRAFQHMADVEEVEDVWEDLHQKRERGEGPTLH